MNQLTATTNLTTQKFFDISNTKIKQIKAEKQIGINKKITITSKKITQTYFSGLVYRLDSRSLSKINASGGFYPNNKKENDEPLLAKNMCKATKYHDNGQDIIESYVYTWDQKGIISTSKNFVSFNVGVLWKNDFKYVIDSTISNNYGLDIDKTMQFLECCEKYEVVFEEPIKNECIIGYFNGINHSNTFYPNSFYKGYFSWMHENVVINYKAKIFKHNFLKYEYV